MATQAKASVIERCISSPVMESTSISDFLASARNMGSFMVSLKARRMIATMWAGVPGGMR